MEGRDWIRSSAVSRDGARLAASFDDGEVRLWRGRGQEPIVRVKVGTLAASDVVLSPGLDEMAAQFLESAGEMWNLSS